MARAHIVALLLASSYCSAYRHGRPAVLRFRGGADDGIDEPEIDDATLDFDEPDEEQQPLTRAEIIARLNRVPTFAIMNGDGGVMSMRHVETNASMACWYLDAEEASIVFESVVKTHPGGGLRLGVHGLGAAFAACGGFAGEVDDGSFNVPDKEASFEGTLKLLGPQAVVQECEEKLQTLLTDNGFEPLGWTLPAFVVTELAAPGVLPVFFHPRDIAMAWMQAGGKKEDLPETSHVIDLRVLVRQMLAGASAWRDVQFIVSPEAIKLATKQTAKLRDLGSS